MRNSWEALIDDLHAEFDQGHMKVDGIVGPHRQACETAMLLDAAMIVEAMTYGRVFPGEPNPTTRDFVVFTHTAGHIKRVLRALAEPER